jgi:hypothetical protein
VPLLKKSFSQVHTAATVLACSLVAGYAALPQSSGAAQTGPAFDSREVYSRAAPSWLRAVGKLLVPGSTYRDGARAHLLENCSATLVTRLPDKQADTLITAWHCLVNYRDLSRPIIFTLPAESGGSLQREAYQLADGGGMHADWALMRLRLPVSPAEATALLVHPGRADPARAIAMAGYSRDEGKGEGGNRLTFDPVCRIIGQGTHITASDCLAHKGASGGAVVQRSAAGTVQLSGVVSEGDGAGLSTFVPVAAFRSAINRYLN